MNKNSISGSTGYCYDFPCQSNIQRSIFLKCKEILHLYDILTHITHNLKKMCITNNKFVTISMIYALFISFVAILYNSQKSKYIFFLVSINHHFKSVLNF